MKQRELVSEIARRLPFTTRSQVEDVIEVLTELWADELAAGRGVSIPTLGNVIAGSAANEARRSDGDMEASPDLLRHLRTLSPITGATGAGEGKVIMKKPKSVRQGYSQRVSVGITAEQRRRLEEILRARARTGQMTSLADVLRSAVSLFIAQQDDIPGTRAAITRRLESRFEEVEERLAGLETNCVSNLLCWSSSSPSFARNGKGARWIDKQMCIANVQYKKPSANQSRQMKNLVKYLTYREGRDRGAPQVRGRARWMNRGMGGSVAEIARQLRGLKSKHVLMFSLVVNPNPDLVAMVPHDQRGRFVRQLTERTVEDFFDARGIENGVEWSAVLHHRETDDAQSPGQHNPHMHVVLPGTYYDEDAGERLPLYFSQNRGVDHFKMLHDITEGHTAALMEKYVGRDWEQRIDELERIREQQREVVNRPALGCRE